MRRFDLVPGDEATVGDVIGLAPDGRLLIHHGAPFECLAVWKVGPTTDGESASATTMTLSKQGRRPESDPELCSPGCGCGGR